ncbi:MAG: HPr family phosphocarrier protein [Victivallaceae bacterium]
MTSRSFTVRNKAGIHCRPSGVILTAIKNEFPGLVFEIETADGQVTRLDSMLTILSLGLGAGARATLRVSGGDEAAAAERIAALFETEFDFPPRAS